MSATLLKSTLHNVGVVIVGLGVGDIRDECVDGCEVTENLCQAWSETPLRPEVDVHRCVACMVGTMPPRIQRSESGGVVELPEVGGLHHPYERVATAGPAVSSTGLLSVRSPVLLAPTLVLSLGERGGSELHSAALRRR